MGGMVDHQKIDDVVSADRVTKQPSVTQDHRTSADVLLNVPVRRTTAKEGIDCRIPEEGTITFADRSTRELDQGAEV
jgi:hypothetical protein